MATTTTKPVLEILLIDDAAEVRADMADYFARQGHRVEQCGDGDQALELVERRVFDVLVLDLVMPGRSGLDVLRELNARHAECEVVVLTGELYGTLLLFRPHDLVDTAGEDTMQVAVVARLLQDAARG